MIISGKQLRFDPDQVLGTLTSFSAKQTYSSQASACTSHLLIAEGHGVISVVAPFLPA